jgi:hypothetical protein
MALEPTKKYRWNSTNPADGLGEEFSKRVNLKSIASRIF